MFYAMKSLTRQHVTSVERTAVFAWSRVSSPRDEAQRTSVCEAMATRDFMHSLRSRDLKVIWAQHSTGRSRETRPDIFCSILPAKQAL